MNIAINLIGKLLRWDKQAAEYWVRFMQPKMEYALSIGMPADTLNELAQRALDESDGVVTFPGTLLRDLIAEWEEDNAK